MTVVGLLSNSTIKIGSANHALPDWLKFPLLLGEYASSQPGFYCCVIVPDAALAALLVAKGADLSIGDTSHLLEPNDLAYVRYDESSSWKRAVCSEVREDFIVLILDRETDAKVFVPVSDTSRRIRKAPSASSPEDWLRKKITKVTAIKEIQLLETGKSTVAAELFGIEAEFRRAAELKWLRIGSKEVFSLDDLLALQSSMGVRSRAFNVGINNRELSQCRLHVYTEHVPDQQPSFENATICLLSAGNRNTELYAGTFIDQFRASPSYEPVEKLPFWRQALNEDGIRGIEFCGVQRGSH
ncbi:hypothetical protein SAMN04487881_0026 [Marinobacter sp. es.048]|uniref:hypothetical protein n=1 Tax=Marinobacter sp. es.048 TaxID=1761795 RepID=UPI000B5908FF|nr:hypothetical protein [Marinobacter sp. es.048]SNC59287.1 hypothetical protein SAMN04487881_0026 [Marinobacter sp. es.048]